MDLNDTKFWENVGLIVILFVFITGAGIAIFQVGKISFNKISGREQKSLFPIASVEKALERSKIETDKQTKNRKTELLKMPAYKAPFLGEEDAPTEIEGFFDFSCPYTKVFFDDFPLHAKKDLL